MSVSYFGPFNQKNNIKSLLPVDQHQLFKIVLTQADTLEKFIGKSLPKRRTSLSNKTHKSFLNFKDSPKLINNSKNSQKDQKTAKENKSIFSGSSFSEEQFQINPKNESSISFSDFSLNKNQIWKIEKTENVNLSKTKNRWTKGLKKQESDLLQMELPTFINFCEIVHKNSFDISSKLQDFRKLKGLFDKK